jgi:2-polyprenyl-6-methoxyphenol hydroxylase-like FAD-dependent oxidoreductase
MSPLRVLIVGAGPAGLVLGRCLHHRGIPAIIYEKAKPSPHRNSYGITLYAQFYRPLLKVLDLDETTFRKRVAVDAQIGGMGKVTANVSDEEGGFRANRSRFEGLLAEGLDVRWESEVESIDLGSSSEGEVTVALKGGEKQTPTVVVGADGPHSIVREAVAKGVELKVLPYATYNGKRRVSVEEFQKTFKPAMGEGNKLEQRMGDALLQISVGDRDEEKVSLSYVYSRAPRGKKGEDTLYRPEREKGAAREMPEELFAELGVLAGKLEEPFRTVFDAETVRKDRLLNWLMRSLHMDVGQLREAAKGGVVLLGDAVHAEPILGGEGKLSMGWARSQNSC